MTTTALVRDPEINTVCPPHRRHDDRLHDDRLYAEWVRQVVSTLPPRDMHYVKADLDGWDAWQAEGRNVTTWMAAQGPALARVILTDGAAEMGMDLAEFVRVCRMQLADGDWTGGAIDLESVCEMLPLADHTAQSLTRALDEL